MAYSTINKHDTYFNNTLITGDGSSSNALTGVGHRPDFIWMKRRNATGHHRLIDTNRGISKIINSDLNNAEATTASYVTAIGSDGWTIGSNTDVNASGGLTMGWSWSAGGASPTKTYTVKVVSDSGNKYRFDDFGTSAVTLDLQEGGTYTFDSSDSTVNSHPFVLGTSSGVDGSYTTGVTYKLDGVTKTYSQYTSGFSSATSRQLIITVAASAPTLYYNCSVHSGMGGQINTNSTFGSSNFDGTIKSVVSHNSAAGFSIIKYSGTGSGGATIGHELGNKPAFVMFKNLEAAVD